MRKWLVVIRKEKKMTQENVARETGISRTAYAMYEYGKRNPTVKTAKKTARILGFDWTRFFDD